MPPVQHCLTRKVNQSLVSLRHHGLRETHTVTADALPAGAAIVIGQQSGPAGNDLLDEEMSPLKRATSARAGRNQTAMNGPAPITDGIVQFDGEREMWASFQDANLRKRRRLKVLVGGAALLVSLAWSSAQHGCLHAHHRCSFTGTAGCCYFACEGISPLLRPQLQTFFRSLIHSLACKYAVQVHAEVYVMHATLSVRAMCMLSRFVSNSSGCEDACSCQPTG